MHRFDAHVYLEVREVIAAWLWIATVLFVLRVLGQMLVILVRPRWLPPVDRWQSGLLPYPVLLLSQLAILAAQVTIAIQAGRGAGWFVEPLQPRVGAALVVLAALYLGGMAYRLSRPSPRLIPTMFHCVLASFLLAAGLFHLT